MVACALLLGAGQTWAQIDVTSEYLTNASVTNADGWTGGATATDANWTGAPENVCLNHGWWTSATNMYQTVTLPKGLYRLTAMTRGHASVNSNIYAYDVSAETYLASADVTKNGDAGDNNGWGETSIEFTITESKSIRIGWSCDATDEVWANADYFKLYRLTVADVTSTYITNAGFDACTAETSDVAAKTIKDYSSNGWTKATSGSYTTIAVTAYGDGKKLATSTTPTTKKDGTTVSGNTLGIIAGWADEVKIQSGDITLPAGIYTLTVDHYLTPVVNKNNYNSSSSRCGFVTASASYLVSSTTFTASTWTTETVTFTLTESTTGKVQIGLKGTNSDGSGAHAVFYDDVTLTYMPFAEAADYTELSTAISTVEAYTLGFDAGEYASYNVLPILNAAKAINQEANNSLATVRELIDALNAITANAAEVNAIFDGSFEHDYSGLTGNVQPLGWYRVKNTTGDGYNVRYVTKSSNAGVDYTSSDCALFTKLQAYYGWDADYLMPLKANTYYTVSFIVGGAGDCDDLTNNIDIINPSEETTRIKTYAVPNKTANTDASSDSWITVSATFKTGDAGNYVLGLVPRNSGNKSQNQFLYGDISLVRATASEIKPFLLAEITAANAIYNSGANVGTGVFQVPTAAGDAFNTAINTTAQGVYDNASATVDDVITAISNLQTAEATYKSTTINAPADGKKYYIKVATTGHGKLGNAWLLALGSTSDNNPTGYTIQANNAPAAYLCQAYTFTQVSGNTYKISITRPEGEVYLTNGTANGSAAGWKASQIQGNTDSSKAMVFTIEATNEANKFYIYNTETNSTIACQSGGNIYTETGNAYFAVDEASQATVNVTINAAVKYGTRIFPFAPSLPSGVKAYSCEAASDATLTLVEVAEPQTNTPYILEATSGCASTDLKGWGTASADSYTTGWLTGVYTSTAAPNGSYVLQNNDSKVGFYQVDTEKATPTVGAYRCYMTVPTTARPAFFFDDETTGIDAINGLTSGSATVYSVDGHVLPALQKGLNIIKTNGKTYKVMVK